MSRDSAEAFCNVLDSHRAASVDFGELSLIFYVRLSLKKENLSISVCSSRVESFIAFSLEQMVSL